MSGDSQPPSRSVRLAIAALCVVGAVARIIAYSQHRSLWYDEAALALNLVNRGFVGLLAPLDNFQTAPPLFLWAERVMVLIFGPNEWALRAMPLVAGIVLPPLTWRVSRRLVPAPAAVVAVALVALSPALVRYSAEVKPYSLDALVTVMLLDRAIAVTAAGATTKTWWTLAITGMLAVVASTPSVFVLAGVIAFLLVSILMTRDVSTLRRTLALAGGWAATFIALLLTVFRPLVDSQAPIARYMQWYWATNFLTNDAPGLRIKASVLTWAALTETFFGAGAVRGMTAMMVVALLAGVAGLVALRRLNVLALLAVPGLAVIAASTLKRYPIAERLLLFAAPLSVLLMTSALLVVQRVGGHRALSWVSTAGTAVAVALATRGIRESYRSNDGRQESRRLVQAALAPQAAGTPVWVSAGGELAWRFYSGDRAPFKPHASSDSLAGGRTLRHNVLVGAWYADIPERIVTIVDDTTDATRPSAWSENEASRLRRIAKPCALVFLSHAMPGESAALLAGTARLGGRVAATDRAAGAELHRVCFDQRN